MCNWSGAFVAGEIRILCAPARALFLSLSLGVFDRAGDFYGGRRTKAALIFVRTVENVIHKINAARTAATNSIAMAISAKEVHSFCLLGPLLFICYKNTLAPRRTNKQGIFSSFFCFRAEASFFLFGLL